MRASGLISRVPRVPEMLIPFRAAATECMQDSGDGGPYLGSWLSNGRSRLYLTEAHLHAPNKEIEQKPKRGS